MRSDVIRDTVSPLVSVIIPTRMRPQSVSDAVASALAQSYKTIEVIVVVDGSDYETEAVLTGLQDKRLRILVLEKNVGGAEARNIGVRSARGEWVAFLDDDDMWLPEKLEKQIAQAATMQVPYPIISSRLLVKGRKAAQILPRKLYSQAQNMSDYLFLRKRFAYGDGMMQTSTLLVKRALLLEVTFRKGLKQHQDWDWLLKVGWRPDVEFAMLPEALTVMHVESDASVSRYADWRSSLLWARENRPLMTGEAFAFFVTTECVPRACREGVSFFTLMRLLAEIVWNGRPTLRQLALFFFFCVVPEKQRRELRDRTVPKIIPKEDGAFS